MTDRKHLLQQLAIDRDAEPERRFPWGWMLVGIALSAGLVVLLSMFKRGSSEVIVQTSVVRAAANGGATASLLDASGYVVARRQATVSSKVTGKVQSVLIEEGMRVEKDQLLATLEPIDSQKQFNLSQAQANASRAQLADLQVQLNDARTQLQRQKDLKAKGLTPQANLDAAATLVNSLMARLASATRNIEVADASVAVAQQSLDNTKVYAPFAGVVIARSAQVGEIVSPLSAGGGFTRTGIGTIVDMDSLEVEVDVNEAYLEKVQKDAPVEISLNAYPSWKIPGKVLAIIPTADRSKATVKVRVAFAEKDQRVLPDMGARVAFLNSAEAPSQAAKLDGVWIPKTALMDGNAVFLLKEGSLKKTTVQLASGSDASNSSGEVRVLSGLEAGDNVVTTPKSDYADGLKVKVQ